MLLTFNETNDFNHIVAVMYDYFRIGYKGSKKFNYQQENEKKISIIVTFLNSKHQLSVLG